LFPGYNNSSAAGGYFYLDTTPYLNGVHTIAWSVKDNAGNQDGIGSRFFTILNVDGAGLNKTASREQYSQWPGVSMLQQASVSFQPVLVKKGYEIDALSEAVYPDNKGIIAIDLKEDERLEVLVKSDSSAAVSGYAVIGNRPQILPVGSTLDRARGIFYWQPGPGFFGEYSFVFIEKSVDGHVTKKVVKVVIYPKY